MQLVSKKFFFVKTDIGKELKNQEKRQIQLYSKNFINNLTFNTVLALRF
jgi:hypothetical protein